MTELPSNPSRREFTIGHVFGTAWRGFTHRFASVAAICLVAGIVSSFAVQITVFATSQWLWLFREIIQVAVSTCIATPAILLLLETHNGKSTKIGDVAARAIRRCIFIVVGEVVFDVIIVLLAYFSARSLASGSILIVLVIAAALEVIFLAFNCVFLPALAEGPKGFLHALNTAFALTHKNWLRLLIIGFLSSLFSRAPLFAIDFVVGYGGQSLVDWPAKPDWIVGYYLSLAVVARGLGYGIRLMILISIAIATYCSLQRAKYGASPGEMARVFD